MTAPVPEIATRSAQQSDMPAIQDLSARLFGPGRFARSAYRVREGTRDISEFCRVALAGDRVIAAIRMTSILIGGKPGALLLGPLAVDTEFANQGHGRRLIAEVAEMARQAGRELIVLVGDLPYYGRLGFVAVPPSRIVLPGPADPARILVLELVPGALARFEGLVTAAPDAIAPRSRGPRGAG